MNTFYHDFINVISLLKSRVNITQICAVFTNVKTSGPKNCYTAENINGKQLGKFSFGGWPQAEIYAKVLKGLLFWLTLYISLYYKVGLNANMQHRSVMQHTLHTACKINTETRTHSRGFLVASGTDVLPEMLAATEHTQHNTQMTDIKSINKNH